MGTEWPAQDAEHATSMQTKQECATGAVPPTLPCARATPATSETGQHAVGAKCAVKTRLSGILAPMGQRKTLCVAIAKLDSPDQACHAHSASKDTTPPPVKYFSRPDRHSIVPLWQQPSAS